MADNSVREDAAGDIYADLGYFNHRKILAYPRGHEEYERSVATPNMLFRYSRPLYVVQPTNKDQVATVIKWFSKKQRSFTIKCGGHSSAGYSTASPQSVSLDLRKMREAELDLEKDWVDIDAGCQWGHVYKTLINGKHDGLFVNGGRCPLVGVSGFTLGGGLGPFSRSVGMGCDTVAEATIVTAKGEIITVRETNTPDSKEGKLFWALRGAGAANFGVLVNLKMKVQHLKEGGRKVVAGKYTWFPKDGHDANFMETMNRFYTTNWPLNMTIDSTWICECKDGKVKLGVRFLPYFDGVKSEFTETIYNALGETAETKELVRRALEEDSTRFLHETLIFQWSEETKKAFPTNRTYSIYTSFCFENKKEDIEKITEIIKAEMAEFSRRYEKDNAEFLVSFIHSGGKAMEAPKEGTAFYWRKATYHAYITLEWEDKWMEWHMTEFMRRTRVKFRPLSLEGKAIYINFPDNDQGNGDHEEAYFGQHKEKLREVKKIWDPTNFFNWNHGVKLKDDEPKTEVFGLAGLGKPGADNSTDFVAKGDWNEYETKDFTDELKDLIDLGSGMERYLY